MGGKKSLHLMTQSKLSQNEINIQLLLYEVWSEHVPSIVSWNSGESTEHRLENLDSKISVFNLNLD